MQLHIKLPKLSVTCATKLSQKKDCESDIWWFTNQIINTFAKSAIKDSSTPINCIGTTKSANVSQHDKFTVHLHVSVHMWSYGLLAQQVYNSLRFTKSLVA